MNAAAGLILVVAVLLALGVAVGRWLERRRLKAGERRRQAAADALEAAAAQAHKRAAVCLRCGFPRLNHFGPTAQCPARTTTFRGFGS